MSEDKAERDDGGAAFPELGNVAYNSDWQSENGMRLRDWFAGNVAANQMQMNSHNINEHQAKETARWSYMVADALIEARKK